ncbi:F-box only protein 39-like [Mytilus galloprovincialis]|uniref:FBXO39 n=1 Tax=Mytilus edulis TaxID=6550 RepID=A0A8S3SWU8_MYTED|nr:FBXO39 [Mytilus edulis]
MESSWVVGKVCEIFTSVSRIFNSSMEQSTWVDLPDVVVIELFRFLKDKDRAAAALACKNWARLFKTPCLWRSRHFEMGGYRAHNNGSRACAFSSLFGNYVRYLSISCSHPSYHTTKIFQRAIEDVLGKMRTSNLFEFELERLELERFWKYETPRDKLIACFVRFLKTQKYLKIFDMTAAQCNLDGGCRILQAVGNNSGHKVQDVFIEDFFHSRLAVFQTDHYKSAIYKFTNINYLGINYNCLSDEIIETFSKTLEGKLECMNIKVYRNDPHFHTISGSQWSMLRRKCPKLKVTMWFESIGHSTDIIPVLVKEIPLKDLHIWTGYDDDVEWRLAITIDHIANSYANTLSMLSLELDNNHEFVDDNVLALLQKCKKLNQLTLNANVVVSTIRAICLLRSEKKTTLQSLHLTACGLSEQEWTVLCQIKDEFSEMIEQQGLDYKFCTDLLIDLTPM